MSLRVYLRTALFGLCLSLSFAAGAAELPTTTSIQSSLNKISQPKGAEADPKAAQQTPEQKAQQQVLALRLVLVQEQQQQGLALARPLLVQA